jgi:hypothetical protein
VRGTLEETYNRVAGDGGEWILVASVPKEAFKEVMENVKRAHETEGSFPV